MVQETYLSRCFDEKARDLGKYIARGGQNPGIISEEPLRISLDYGFELEFNGIEYRDSILYHVSPKIHIRMNPMLLGMDNCSLGETFLESYINSSIMIPVSPEKDSSKLVLKIKEALSIADAIGIFKDSDFSERLCRCADKNIFVREGMHTYFGMHIQPLSEN